MERLLAEELKGFYTCETREARGGVSFDGTLEAAYRACLWSRIANRILLPLATFKAPDAEALYKGVYDISWQDQFDVEETFAVDFNASSSNIRHSHFGALRVKDAIVDQFRDRQGNRPTVDLIQPDIRLNLYLFRNLATVNLDLSGVSLHRRGYRRHGLGAPLKENLAAAILMRAEWLKAVEQGCELVDPMCGSGTLLVEAAAMAADIAPGLTRKQWGFLRWKGHDEGLWRDVLTEAEERRQRGLKRLPAICGYDCSPRAVRASLDNLEDAGLGGKVEVEVRDISKAAPINTGSLGLLVTNPPYGTRLGKESDIPALYSSLGESLKQRFTGWRAAIFVGDAEIGKHIGLRARKIHTLYNGAMECKLLHFQVSPEWYISNRRFPTPLPPHARSSGAEAFANRLLKNLKRLRRWLQRQQISCYRVYDADLPEYALAVDVYEGEKRWLHVQEYQAPATIDPRKARLRLREALGLVMEILEVGESELFFKVRKQQRGSAQYQKISDENQWHEISEGGCRFLVNLADHLDTGLFLDHRLTRGMLSELAAGRRFLNLFAYTGTATVYAASGRALETTSVDLSNTYLKWAQRNMALNGFMGNEHRFLREDCVEWLKQNRRDKFGLIFLDPPSFSASKRMESTLDLQRDHVTLIQQAARHLDDGGVMIFSNNLRRFRMDHDALKNLRIENISKATLPRDFERNPRIHNCWRIQHKKLAPGSGRCAGSHVGRA